MKDGIEEKDRGIVLTDHARRRMTERRIPFTAVELAMSIGRIFHVRGATVYAIGKKELSKLGIRGGKLSRLDGIRVVVAEGGVVKTVVRNRDFRVLGKHGRKPYAGRRGARRMFLSMDTMSATGFTSICQSSEKAA